MSEQNKAEEPVMSDQTLEILEQKLCSLSLHGDKSLRDISLLTSLAAENETEECKRKLRNVMQKGLERFFNHLVKLDCTENDMAANLMFVRISVPYCSVEFLHSCANAVSNSGLPLTVKLNFHAQIMRSLQSNDLLHSTALVKHTLTLIIANLGTVLNQEDATLSKLCGQLLRRLWGLVDEDFLSDFCTAMTVSFDDYPATRYITMCILVDSYIETGLFLNQLWRYLVQVSSYMYI